MAVALAVVDSCRLQASSCEWHGALGQSLSILPGLNERTIMLLCYKDT